MSYVDQNLMSGESIVYRTRLHWIIFLAPLVVLGFYIMIGVDRAVREPGVESRTLDALGLVGLLSLLASIAMFFSSEFAVTNKRVILKEGVPSPALPRNTAHQGRGDRRRAIPARPLPGLRKSDPT